MRARRIEEVDSGGAVDREVGGPVDGVRVLESARHRSCYYWLASSVFTD